MTTLSSSGRPYILAWLSLLGLTGLSFGADFLSLGGWSLPLALSIALLKAGIVLVFFMHIREEAFSSCFVAALNVTWVILICLGLAADVVAR